MARTPAQQQATRRNHVIMRLRAAWHLLSDPMFSEAGGFLRYNAAVAQRYIDYVLQGMGAETEQERQQRRRTERMRALQETTRAEP